MAVLQYLSAGNITPALVRARRRQNRLARIATPLAARRFVFERILRDGLQRSLTQGRFAVPANWAGRFYGPALRIELPTADVARYMWDWLQSSASAFHCSDFFLANGPLDKVSRPVEQMPIVQETRELLAVDWQYWHTPTYQTLLRSLAAGKPQSRQQVRLDTPEKIDRYFLRFRALAESVLEHGLLPNAAVTAKLGHAPDREIGIALDASGAPVKLPGNQHRFALALTLGLPSIPVEVRMVHSTLLASTCERRRCTPIDAVVALLTERVPGLMQPQQVLAG